MVRHPAHTIPPSTTIPVDSRQAKYTTARHKSKSPTQTTIRTRRKEQDTTQAIYTYHTGQSINTDKQATVSGNRDTDYQTKTTQTIEAKEQQASADTSKKKPPAVNYIL